MKPLILEVIPSFRWVNIKTGAVASVYGAVPYRGESDKRDWETEQVGWTWRKSDGTIGLGRQPAKTQAEAEDVMQQVNEEYFERCRLWEAAKGGTK